MDSVSNSSDVQSKGLALVSGLITALRTGQNSDNGPFADLLSHTQVRAPSDSSQPPVPPPSNSSAGQSAAASNNNAQPSQAQQTSQSQQNDNTGNGTNNSNNTSSANNDTAVPSSSQTPAQQTSASPAPAGQRSGRAKQGTQDSTSDQDAQNDGTQPAAQPLVSTDASQSAASVNVQAPPSMNDPLPLNGPTDNVDNTGLIANATVNPSTGLAANAGQTTNAPAAAAVAPNAAPLIAAPATDVLSSLPAIQTPPNSTDAGNSNATANNSPANATAPGLMTLLTQLQQLATGQIVAAPPTVNSDPSVTANDAQTSNNGGTQPATPSSTQPPEQIDLKSVLTAIAAFKDATTGANNGGAGDNTGINTSLAASAQSATTTSAAASQSNPAPTNKNAPDPESSKWISPAFLDLFNVAPPNPANAGTPLVLAPIAGTVSGNSDTALDTETQSGNGANTRSAADFLTTGNNPLTSALAAPQSANPYDFASQLSATRATQGGSTGLPSPIDQVVLQLSRGLSKDGSSQMTIQLRPAELGRVDVKLNIGSDGKVQGTVTADNPATLGLLLKDVRGLERALQEAGLRADPGSLQFNLRGDGQPGSSFGQTADNQSGFFGNDGLLSSTLDVPGFTNPVETYYLTPGGVNMRV